MSNYTQNYQKIKIFAANGCIVGYAQGDTFYKHVSSSRHFLRKPNGIASDICALEQAERIGAVWVQVVDDDTGTIYRASIPHIWKYGLRIDRGCGIQQVLMLKRWIKISKDGDNIPRQLLLFEA